MVYLIVKIWGTTQICIKSCPFCCYATSLKKKKKYKLDPAHYYTAPGLSWDPMLKLTKVKLELLTEIDMIHFLKKVNVPKGSISRIIQFLPNYNPDEPTSFITYLEATNLYGHSMSQAFPTGGFIWLSQEEIVSILDNNNEGFQHVANMAKPDTPAKINNLMPHLCGLAGIYCFKPELLNILKSSRRDINMELAPAKNIQPCRKRKS
ncbi:hypothetical protein NQ317_005091 [Molorchus minor]|uniref:Uncharacterized protein n=1 Tax=Molorchus minor TaxID=1323400 RepID=A0ABQ9J2C3_9CUCU|nr:hypothetical protein NQ317_005091 [Molorchus minor]